MAVNVHVNVKNGDVDRALSKLSRKMKENDIWVEWEDNQEYTKPSKEKRDARHRAEQRERKRARKEFAWDSNSKYYYKNQNNY